MAVRVKRLGSSRLPGVLGEAKMALMFFKK